MNLSNLMLKGNRKKLSRLLCVTALSTCSVFAYAQQQQVKLTGSNLPLKSVFKQIEKQTDLSIDYRSQDVDDSRIVKQMPKATTVQQAMNQLLAGTDCVVTFSNGHIIIKKQASNTTNQQSKLVKGTIVDATGMPVIGANVMVKGTTNGTITDMDGNFSLEAPVGATLVVSYVGYSNQEIKVGNQKNLSIALKEDSEALDELVVVGYMTQKKASLTGAVASMKMEENLNTISTTSAGNLLAGKMAGVNIGTTSGIPGNNPEISIRTTSSWKEKKYNPQPVTYVIDGVVRDATDFNNLSSNEIENISVLKDAASASIYGSRAANGVIIITTKKGGANQKATFSVNFSQTWSVLPKLPTIMIGRKERILRLKALRNMPQAYLDWENKQYKYPTSLLEVERNPQASMDWFYPTKDSEPADGIVLQDSLNAFYNNATNFFPMYFETGKVTNANIQTYGGTDKMTYGIGLGYYDEAGILKGTGFNRIDLTTNISVTPIERLDVDLRFYISLTNRKKSSENQTDGFQTSTNVEVVPGDPYELTTLLPGEGSVVWDEVLKSQQGIKEKNRSIRGRANVKIGYDIIDGLNISTSLAADYSLHRRHYFSPSYLDEDGFSISVGETGINLMALNETMLSFQKMLKEHHSFNFLVGFSYQYDQEEYNGGSGQNSPSDKIQYVPSGFPTLVEKETWGYTETIPLQAYQSDMKEKSLLSWFARLEYAYKEKYFLSLSFRRDGSSTFGARNRWGSFPAIAGAWNFSEENFVKENFGWLSFGKFRASWGRSGKHFEECYLALGELYSGMSFMGESTLSPGTGLYNEDLSWENTDQYDFGLDLDLFNYRLGITLDYYYRYSDDLLWQITLPGDYNGYSSQWRNAAAISNEGIEWLFRYEIFRKDDLYWKISVNGAKNWNRFEKSYTNEDIPTIGIIGKPLNGIYTLATDGFVNEQDELAITYNNAGIGSYLNNGSKNTFYKPGDYKFVDVNGDGIISDGDQVYQGSALPDVSGGVVNEFQWRNFDLNMSIAFQLGRHIVNTSKYASLMTSYPNYILHPFLLNVDKLHFWESPEDADVDFPQWQADLGVGNYGPTDRDVEKANWLKLKTVTIGYSLPQIWMQKLGIRQIRFFASGENLLSWHNYSGIDPETVNVQTGGDDGRNYPLARKFTLGLTIKF